MSKAILVAGTASHVGKSWMATALCRFLRRRGLRVAPFKAQNMSLNSYPCRVGGEIGRAQVVQAEAAGLQPVPDMNPILLKPNGTSGSQVIVDGKVWRNLSAREYYTHFDFLLERVLAAYHRLVDEFEVIVVEGAGSAVELNLKSRDLVNLGLAARLGIPALLIADIDRGGVFASVVGTFALLEPVEAALVRSFAVNRLRGDPALFDDGRRMLEQRAGRPCLGVFPYLPDVTIGDEDSVSLDRRPAAVSDPGELRVVIIRLPRISNFTDFALLEGAEYITEAPAGIVDCVIIPGTKNTVLDLEWLRERGLERWILEQHAEGAAVWGICGGYQMLGRSVCDPLAVESPAGAAEGLGLLPCETVLEADKTTRVVEAQSPDGHHEFRAYEIHMGRTLRPDVAPFAMVEGRPEGVRDNGIIGTYLHGALEDPVLLQQLLDEVAARRHKIAPRVGSRHQKDAAYERLADWFEENADMRLFEALYLR